MSPLDRAQLGYDADFERKLASAIITAIAGASMIENCLVIRTGETAAALTTVLASMLGLSPSAARSPRAIKQITKSFGRKLTANVRAAENNPDFFRFKERTFRNDDRERGGHA
jgi:hypothetical protein